MNKATKISTGKRKTNQPARIRLSAGIPAAARKTKAEQVAKEVRDYTNDTLAELRTVVGKLLTVVDIARTIEEDRPSYIDEHDLAAFARLRACEVGEIIEQALCDLGIIDENPTSCFVGDLKRRPIVLQELAHG